MFQFEEYTLDVDRGHLRTEQREIELRPKSFEVLRYLVENAGRLVSKDELIKTVWPNVIVTDESLTQCVSEVRQAIGDRDQTKIKTVPRRGYRFVVQVSQRSPSTIGPAASEPVTAELQSGHRSARPMPDPPSIAVLPFANLSSDPHRDYFSDGITEDIITELSRFSELVVIARTSAFQYKGKAIDIRQVGRELNVRYILEGSIRWAGNRVRITAQLIDSATGAHRWADSFDREVGDDFTVQDEVARSIVLTLAAHVTKAETKRTLLKPPSTWEAYDYYLRGADAFRSGYAGHTRDSICEARRLLEQSLLIDPNYARAHALLARTHLHAYIEPADDDYLRASTLERAYELAKRAVQLDPNLPEVHSQLGWVVMFLRQHDAAIAEFERATVLNRNFNDYGYGFALALAGRAARAIEILHANMRLDPFQFRWLAVHGHAHYMLGRYEEAVPPLRECASYFPNLRIVHVWLAATYGKLGRLAEARSAAADVRRIEPTFTIDKWKVTAVYKDSEDAERLFEGLREAGLPQR